MGPLDRSVLASRVLSRLRPLSSALLLHASLRFEQGGGIEKRSWRAMLDSSFFLFTEICAARAGMAGRGSQDNAGAQAPCRGRRKVRPLSLERALLFLTAAPAGAGLALTGFDNIITLLTILIRCGFESLSLLRPVFRTSPLTRLKEKVRSVSLTHDTLQSGSVKLGNAWPELHREALLVRRLFQACRRLAEVIVPPPTFSRPLTPKAPFGHARSAEYS